MVAPINKNSLFMGSSGSGRFKLASGQEFVIQMDDKDVIAELRKRGLWHVVNEHAKIGTSFALPDQQNDGVDVFVWFGRKQDGGFTRFSFPGANMLSPDVKAFIQYLSNALFANGRKGRWKEVRHG